MEDPTLSFDFPDPAELRSPMITLEQAAVGYGEAPPILKRLNFRIEADDRIALLGRNGNGKTTLARLLASQLAPAEGAVNAPGKLKVGYFTQYQVEELAGEDTPVDLMNRAMEGQSQGAVRAQLGRFGFSGPRAQQRVEKLSGGERARLALALITRDAPHLLILDEPTNHLDVDAREALIQALNNYTGAVILISHDRHMVELTSDRLVLVDGGTAREYDGSMDDYIDFILGRNQPKGERRGKSSAGCGAGKGGDKRSAQSAFNEAEAAIARLSADLEQLDEKILDLSRDAGGPAGAAMQGLLSKRAAAANALAEAEETWLAAGSVLETIQIH
jgi:ATP-binding cassette subfamily F protein 3